MLAGEVIGNLGYDAVLKEVNGKSQINMSVAHSDYEKDASGNRIEKRTWVSVTWFSNGGNLLQYLKSGAKIFVRGRQRISVYQDNSGQWKAGINIVANEVVLCGSKKEASGQIDQTAASEERTEQIFPDRNGSNYQDDGDFPG